MGIRGRRYSKPKPIQWKRIKRYKLPTEEWAYRTLAPIRAFLQRHHGSMAALIREYNRRVDNKIRHIEMIRWLNPDPEKRVEPKFGAGLVLLDAFKSVQARVLIHINAPRAMILKEIDTPEDRKLRKLKKLDRVDYYQRKIYVMMRQLEKWGCPYGTGERTALLPIEEEERYYTLAGKRIDMPASEPDKARPKRGPKRLLMTDPTTSGQG